MIRNDEEFKKEVFRRSAEYKTSQRKKICGIASGSIPVITCALIVSAAMVPMIRIKTKSSRAYNETDNIPVTYEGFSSSLYTNIYLSIDGVKYAVTDPAAVDIISEEIGKLDINGGCNSDVLGNGKTDEICRDPSEKTYGEYSEKEEMRDNETDSRYPAEAEAVYFIYFYDDEYILCGNTLTASDNRSVLLTDGQIKTILNTVMEE